MVTEAHNLNPHETSLISMKFMPKTLLVNARGTYIAAKAVNLWLLLLSAIPLSASSKVASLVILSRSCWHLDMRSALLRSRWFKSALSDCTDGMSTMVLSGTLAVCQLRYWSTSIMCDRRRWSILLECRMILRTSWIDSRFRALSTTCESRTLSSSTVATMSR